MRYRKNQILNQTYIVTNMKLIETRITEYNGKTDLGFCSLFIVKTKKTTKEPQILVAEKVKNKIKIINLE